MRAPVYPYRLATSDAVGGEDWRVFVNTIEMNPPSQVPGWDYNTNLSVRRSMTIDTTTVRESAGLPSGSALSLVVIWESTGSRQQVCCLRRELPSEGTHPIEIEIDLRGSDLGGTVTLITSIVLAEQRTSVEPFTAHLPGSELWGDRFDILLEEERDLFPIAIIDFALTDFPESAAWYLEISGTLEAPASGSLLLCVNKANKAAAQAFTNLMNPTPVDLAITSSAYADVTRTLIEYALTLDDFDEDSDYPDDSLGAALQGIVRRFFEGRNVEDVQRLRSSDPTGFASEIQAATELYRELN